MYRMALAEAEGAKQVPGTTVELRRVPELVPLDILKASGAFEAQKVFAHVPVAKLEEIVDGDAIIFGTGTRFGNMTGQMRMFLDAAGPLWAKQRFEGKVGSVFTGSASQHGGQESTIMSFYNTLFHLGFIIVGLPYSFTGQMRLDEITGCSPYGASTITGGKGERWPSENELAGARYQGKYVAEITRRLLEGKKCLEQEVTPMI